jgi:hypothetical protein
MALRVTRPAFMTGIRKVKAAAGVADYDVNRDATRLEMRAFVCGQCHVVYYFRGPEKTLTFPWENGLKADEIFAYYQESGFADWTHAESGAPTLKAQHPEFEMWNQGTHARAGVVCPDCHMPYRRVGALKVSDHQVRSPLLMVDASCQTCHKASEEELTARAQTIQQRTFEENSERGLSHFGDPPGSFRPGDRTLRGQAPDGIRWSLRLPVTENAAPVAPAQARASEALARPSGNVQRRSGHRPRQRGPASVHTVGKAPRLNGGARRPSKGSRGGKQPGGNSTSSRPARSSAEACRYQVRNS